MLPAHAYPCAGELSGQGRAAGDGFEIGRLPVPSWSILLAVCRHLRTVEIPSLEQSSVFSTIFF